MKIALTIAGSDSGGGAGIQADIKAFQANNVFAATVLTAVTAQNTQEVRAAIDLPAEFVTQQLDAVCDDLEVAAVKTGMLSSAAIIGAVAKGIRKWKLAPLVVDPVMISKSGYRLLRDDAVSALRTELLPLADLVTPNAHEAGLLAGMEVRSIEDAIEAARRIIRLGPAAVLVKGGHIDAGDQATDIFFDGDHFQTFTAPLIETRNTHGTGCTYGAAIAANLARGFALRVSIARAKRYVTEAIRHGLDIGHGHGPTHHFYFLEEMDAFPVRMEEPAIPPARLE
jgi:hydroxymethylpyrimidine/phosphomethylpyrimidine kinase